MKHLYSIVVLTAAVATLVVGCGWNPYIQDAPNVEVGSNAVADLVIYFKAGTTEAEVESFNQRILRSRTQDVMVAESVASTLRLAPDHDKGRWGFAVDYYRKVSSEQSLRIKQIVESDDLVSRVYENVAPANLRNSDLE